MYRNCLQGTPWTQCTAKRTCVKIYLKPCLARPMMPNRGKTCKLGASGHISICRGIWMDALILSQTRHMSSQKTSNNNFLTILMEFKFPSGYVGPLSSRIANGKLRGLKTHDFHILLQQVLPLCLRNVGNPKVVGAIMRVSRFKSEIPNARRCC